MWFVFNPAGPSYYLYIKCLYLLHLRLMQRDTDVHRNYVLLWLIFLLLIFFFFSRNPSSSDSEVITVENLDSTLAQAYVSALLSSGFREKDDYGKRKTFLPCPPGTFMDPSNKGKGGCQICPAG